MKDSSFPYLRLYSDVTETSIEWLWYPFIPYGKITLLQGDPGEGKSLLMMNIIAALSNGAAMPDNTSKHEPQNSIYQCSEDSVSDTIKPRLLAAGANVNRVAFVDEDAGSLTLEDDRIRLAIEQFSARLLVIDPIQAYLGDADLTNISNVRRIMRRLAFWASLYNCAIVLIGHLNKREGSKNLYRGFGSIDVVAAARSVLHIDHDEENPSARILHHVKSSLAPAGECISFYINRGRFQILQDNAIDGDDPLQEIPVDRQETKKEIAEALLKEFVAQGPVRATTVMEKLKEKGISSRTVNKAKKSMGLKSMRKNGQWYWTVADSDEKPASNNHNNG